MSSTMVTCTPVGCENGGKLAANHAASNDHQGLRRCGSIQQLVAVHHKASIHL